MTQPLFREVTVATINTIAVPERSARIERVPADKPIDGVVLCKALFHIETHFANGHGRICPGQAECEYHKTHRLIPYFLCAIYNKESRRAIWLQLPPNAAKALLFAVQVLQRELYGTECLIGRQWKAMNAPVTVQVPPLQLEKRLELPRPMTPEKAIAKCFFSANVSGKKRKPTV